MKPIELKNPLTEQELLSKITLIKKYNEILKIWINFYEISYQSQDDNFYINNTIIKKDNLWIKFKEFKDNIAKYNSFLSLKTFTKKEFNIILTDYIIENKNTELAFFINNLNQKNSNNEIQTLVTAKFEKYFTKIETLLLLTYFWCLKYRLIKGKCYAFILW